MKLSPAQRSLLVHESEIVEFSNKNPTEEVCGMLMKSGGGGFKAQQLPNRAEDRKSAFMIDAVEFLELVNTGQVWGTWHTHPGPLDPDGPSDADRHISNAWELPGCVYVRHSGRFHYWLPDGYKAPLLGRLYCPQIFDCYSIVRDALLELLDYDLPDLDRSRLDPSGHLAEHDKIWAPLGFEFVLQPKAGRIAVMDFAGHGRANHIGLLLTDYQMLHQLREERSAITYLDASWRKCVHGYLRHSEIEEKMKSKGWQQTGIPVMPLALPVSPPQSVLVSGR